MRLKEQRLWDRLSANLKHRTLWLRRIENRVGEGDPDVNALCNGIFTAIELKSVESWPVRDATPVLGRKGLSVAQRNWHMKCKQHRGRSIIVVGVGGEIILAVDGSWHDQINHMTRPEMLREAFAVGYGEIAFSLGVRP